ncbi:hypothetical protein G6F71_003284 [Rhizopus microsporus]|nr:hypothetical protein G6F71_003284 [Rhizopus microsporus]KAG1235180.1 hypothetical protein G6F67_002961 [Rhizopus microsporus]
MSSIVEIMRKRLMDSIRSVQPPSKWKIIVVDSKSTHILNAACKMYDILEENVTLVENIEKKRQPYPSLEAIYFLTPCRESIYRLVDDLSSKPPTYKVAHVHFTGGNDDLFAELNRKLKSSGAAEYVQSLKELYVDFMVSESLVFTVDPVTSFLTTFGDSSRPDEALRQTAKQLLSVCATLGEDPIIRYQIQSEGGEIHSQSPASKLAQIVQQEVDNFCRLNPNFPPPRNPPQPRATLLILDRSIDPVAPLLHEFTYQAMINDLLPVQETDNHVGIKYTYEFHQADGTLGSQEVTLDEEDNVYKSIRHMHIAQCSDYLIERFNEFLSENKSSNEPKTTAKSLKEMKEKLTNLPQYQDMKSKYSAHLSIAQECMSYFERHKLNSVGNLEQNMATGETADGEIPKTIVLDMVPLLDDPSISPVDKARLLMLYIIWKEGGIFEDDKRKLMEHAKLKGELRDAINNLPLIGVKLTRVRRQEKSSFIKKRRERYRRNKDEEQPYELSRYVPVVKKIMEAHFSGTLEAKQFGYTRQSDMDPTEETGSPGGLPASGVSLRSTKPTWAKKNSPGSPRPTNGAKLIVFIVGGATYSEIRSVYEVAEAYHRDVFIGTTELLRPAAFVEHLSNLRRPVPTPPALIAPYVPPQKPVEVSKATSLMNHMHIGSSPQLSSKSSSLSLSTIASDTKSSVTTEEKKKKKGLKRLFG